MTFKKKLKRELEIAASGMPPFKGPLKVLVSFYLTRPKSQKKATHHVVRGDVDNYFKVLDVANGLIWDDDSQIVDLQVFKHYAPESGPFIYIEVVELT